jgi:hypothetical protein
VLRSRCCCCFAISSCARHAHTHTCAAAPADRDVYEDVDVHHLISHTHTQRLISLIASRTYFGYRVIPSSHFFPRRPSDNIIQCTLTHSTLFLRRRRRRRRFLLLRVVRCDLAEPCAASVLEWRSQLIVKWQCSVLAKPQRLITRALATPRL